MATNLETLQVGLRLDASQFRAGMAQAQKNLGGMQKTIAEVGKKTANIGKILTVGVTLPLAGAGIAAVKFATDQTESLNKVNEVFGDNAKVMRDWSKGSARAFGLSRAESLEAVGTLGNLFKGVGLSNDLLPEFSQNIVGAAADLGSFNNADPSQVLGDIQSGLVGQAEPLRKYGILLNAAAVEAKGLELGLADSNGELSEGAKVQARYALIMEQLGDAQGDFARTSDGLANKTRILRARFEDIAAELGEVLIPVVEDVLEVVETLMDHFDDLSKSTKTSIVVVGALAAALGPAAIALGLFAQGLAAIVRIAPLVRFALRGMWRALLGPLGLVVLAISAAVLAWQTNFLGFRDFIQNEFIDRITEHFEDFMDVFNRLREEGFSPINAAIRALGSALEDLTGIEMSAFFFRAAEAADAMIATLRLAWGWFTNVGLPAIADFASGVWGWITGTAVPAFERAFNAIADFLQPIVDWIINTGIPNIQTFAQTIWDWLTGTAIPGLKKLWDDVEPKLTALFNWFKDTFIPKLGEWVETIQTAATDIVDALTGLWDDAKAKLNQLKDFWTDLENAIVGFKDKLVDIKGDIVGAFQDLWDSIPEPPDFVKDLFGFSKEVVGAGAPGAGLVTEALAATTQAQEIVKPLRLAVPLAGVAAEDIRTAVLDEFDRMVTDADNTMNRLKGTVNGAFFSLNGTLNTHMDTIHADVANEFVGVRNSAETIATDLNNKVSNQFVGLRNNAAQLAFSLNNRVTNEFVGMRNNAISLTASLAAGVVGTLHGLAGSAGAAAFNIGLVIGGGLANGISAMVSSVASAAANIVSSAISAARVAAAIASPSRRMMELGGSMAEGLALGMERGERRVAAAMAGLATPPGVQVSGGTTRSGIGGQQFTNYGTLNLYTTDAQDFYRQWSAVAVGEQRP